MALTSVQEFHRPESDGAVIELLARYEGRAMIVAGGTFLHGLSARGLLTGIEALIDIGGTGLDALVLRDQGLDIGATVRFATLKAAAEVHSLPWLGAVADALEYPPVQVLNAATVGGSVAASCPYFDLPVSFLALDGRVRIRSAAGVRELPLADFFTGLFQTALAGGEFVAGVHMPAVAGRVASAFTKLETNANDLAILNVAASVAVDAAGLCREARVYVGGGVGEVPVRARSAEAALRGSTLTDEVLQRAGEAARADVDPIADHRASAEYRRAMTAVMVRRTLGRARDRLQTGRTA